MALNVAPITQEISVNEAQQGGAGARKTLTPEQQKTVDRFVKAHQSAFSHQDPNEQTNAPERGAATQYGPQVDATEQAFAVSARGRSEEVKVTTQRRVGHKKAKAVYRILFTTDDAFLKKDLASLANALRTRSKSLADLSNGSSASEKAVRKYLLAKMINSDNPVIQANAAALITSIEKQYGDLINATFQGFDSGITKPLQVISLKDYIKAFQIAEVQPAENSFQIIDLYKAIRKNITDEHLEVDLQRMKNELTVILEREKTQSPTRVTTSRQHLLLSRINQLDLLIKAKILHDKFLHCCAKAKLTNLPGLGGLLESCLQAVASSEIIAGLNGLVRIAQNVKATNKPANNIFMANYLRMVLQNNQLKGLYPTNFQRRQLLDGIYKNLKAQGILAVGAAHE